MSVARGGRVFISHSAEDAAVAYEICAQIERRGIACWIAPRDVVAGDEFVETIDSAIETTPAFVLVLSRSANTSSYVKSETEMAFSYQRPIFPIRVENVEPDKSLKLFINRWHRVDAIGAGREAGIRRLCDAVSRRVSAGSGGRIRGGEGRTGGSRRPDTGAAAGGWHWPAFAGGIFWLFRHRLAGLGWLALAGLLAFVLFGTLAVGEGAASLPLLLIGWLAIAALIGLRASSLRAGAPVAGQGVPAILASCAAILVLLVGLRAIDEPAEADVAAANASEVNALTAEERPPGSTAPPAARVDERAIAEANERRLQEAYSNGVSDTWNILVPVVTPTENTAQTIDITGATNGM